MTEQSGRIHRSDETQPTIDSAETGYEAQNLDIRLGAPVETSDGKRVGRVDRAVLDPENRRVTDVICDLGGLIGREIVIPVGAIELADEDGVRLIFAESDLERLPDFVESAYLPLDSQDSPPLITWEDGSPDDGRAVLVPAAQLYDPAVKAYAPQIVEEQRNTAPGGTADITVGTVVEDESGEQEIGKVVEVTVDAETGRLTGIVFDAGGETRLLGPADFQIVEGDPIRLRIRSAVDPVIDPTERR